MSAAASHRRALVVAYCFPPHAAIGTHRTLRLVNHLLSTGWDVDVLTVNPRYFLPGTPVDEGLLRLVPASARVTRTRALRGLSTLGRWIQPLKRGVRPVPAGQATVAAHGDSPASSASAARGGLKTLVEELCAMPDKDIGWLAPAVLAGTRAHWKRPPNVVFSSAPPWTTHLVAKAVARALGARWVADFRDPWVRSPWTRYRTGAAAGWARRMEAGVVARADALLFTTDSARREFASYYGARVDAKLHTVANGCDPADLPRDIQPEPGRFVLLHAGSLYGGRSPVPLLRAVSRLCQLDPSVAARLHVRFLGSTGFPGVDLPALCRELGIERVVEFLPRVDRQQSLVEMMRASALLLLQSGTAMAIPGKLYEYLAAGQPLLALCDEGEMTDLIATHQLGLVAPPLDESAIERALAQLVAAPRQQWHAAPSILFDGRLRAAEMAAVLENVLPTRPEQVCVA